MCLHGNNTFLSPWLPASFPVYIFFWPIVNNSSVHIKLFVQELTPCVLSHTESPQEGGVTPSTATVKLSYQRKPDVTSRQLGMFIGTWDTLRKQVGPGQQGGVWSRFVRKKT